MTEAVDKIGVVRDHRWIKADQQAAILAPRCRIVVALGRGAKAQEVSRDDLVRLVRPGTMVECVHAFLLAEPRMRHRPGGMKADLRMMIGKLERRGAVISDVDAGLTTASEGHKKAMLALADHHIGRHNRGLKSALNGALSRGRPTYRPTKGDLAKAKAIWRNVKDYPEWKDAAAAFEQEVSQFTTARAFKLWKGRT
jgi:hypothetical protein